MCGVVDDLHFGPSAVDGFHPLCPVGFEGGVQRVRGGVRRVDESTVAYGQEGVELRVEVNPVGG